MGFDVIEKGEGGDKEIKVRVLVVLDSIAFARAAEEKYRLGLGLDPSGGRGEKR